jgi:hypothetical protein
LGHLSEKNHLGFNWRSSVVPSVRAPELGERTAVFKALRSILGETGGWEGYRVSLDVSKTPSPAFGFRTKSAEEVWVYARKIAEAHPKEASSTIISKAIEQSGIPVSELTPEDMKLLEMAVNWYLAGKITGTESPKTPPYGGNNTSGTQDNFPDSGSL